MDRSPNGAAVEGGSHARSPIPGLLQKGACMTRFVQRVIEIVIGVVGFDGSFPSTDPGYLVVMSRLGETLTRARAVAAKQQNGIIGARGAREMRDALQRSLRKELIPALVRVGGVLAKERTDLAAKFRFPPQASNQVFLVSVKALLAEAESQREALVKEGMIASWLSDFSASVSAFEAASDAARNARNERIAATADLDLIARDLLVLVRVLDGINRYRFRKDPETMAAWNAVNGLPFRSKRGDVVPPGPAEIAPAA
jgi:hypothetical protein